MAGKQPMKAKLLRIPSAMLLAGRVALAGSSLFGVGGNDAMRAG